MTIKERIIKQMKTKGVTVNAAAKLLKTSPHGFIKKLDNNALGSKDAVLLCDILAPANPTKLFFEN